MVDMSGRRRLRAAVIGTGFVGPHHIDAVRRGGFAEVVLVADTDPQRAEACAAALGVPAWTTDVGGAIVDSAIDVVHICTPNATHEPLTTAALHADKHVVVEKPLATDTAAARRLAVLARARGRHGMVSFTYRGYPMVRAARALVASGDVGELRLAHGAYLQDWLSDASDYNWRLDPAVAGSSRAVADIGMHWFDTAEFVTGLRVSAVLADIATLIPERWRPEAGGTAFGTGSGARTKVRINTEDAANILLRFEGGQRGALVVSQVSPGHRNDLAIEVAGSLRSLAWRQEQPEQLWVGSRTDRQVIDRPQSSSRPGVPSLPPGHPEGWGEALSDLFRAFYEAIADGREPPDVPAGTYPTLDEGTRAVAFVDAVLRSSRSGRWESIDA
jgi:predicted dehydrogenase